MQSYVNINFHLERQVLLKKLLDSLVTTELQNFETNLQFKLSAIKVPTLIIWGKNDEVSVVLTYNLRIFDQKNLFCHFLFQMLHVSGAKFLAENIENSELRIIDDCNHVLHIDQPKKTTKHILDFIKSKN
jgi:pimeloyl-ACP methyl ester carboxylesterase